MFTCYVVHLVSVCLFLDVTLSKDIQRLLDRFESQMTKEDSWSRLVDDVTVRRHVSRDMWVFAARCRAGGRHQSSRRQLITPRRWRHSTSSCVTWHVSLRSALSGWRSTSVIAATVTSWPSHMVVKVFTLTMIDDDVFVSKRLNAARTDQPMYHGIADSPCVTSLLYCYVLIAHWPMYFYCDNTLTRHYYIFFIVSSPF